MRTENQADTKAGASQNRALVRAIEDAMTLIGSHASKETDLGRAIDGAWNELDDILECIKDGSYNEAGEFVA